MIKFTPEEIGRNEISLARKEGAYLRASEILHAIEAEIFYLHDQDVNGHIYWERFKNLVITFEPSLSDKQIITEEIITEDLPF